MKQQRRVYIGWSLLFLRRDDEQKFVVCLNYAITLRSMPIV